MPQCPICNAAIWVGERYCANCYNYLPSSEEKDHFCSKCNIRVAPHQEFCHKCKAALPGIEGTKRSDSGHRPPIGVRGILMGTGLVIGALLVVLLLTRSPRSPQHLVTPLPQVPAKQTYAAPPEPTVKTAPVVPAAAPSPKAPSASESTPSPPEVTAPPEVTTPAPSFPTYVVNIDDLALRDGPAVSAPRIGTLNQDDEVELMETSGRWGKVRDVQRNIIGWSARRYLTRDGN